MSWDIDLTTALTESRKRGGMKLTIDWRVGRLVVDREDPDIELRGKARLIPAEEDIPLEERRTVSAKINEVYFEALRMLGPEGESLIELFKVSFANYQHTKQYRTIFKIVFLEAKTEKDAKRLNFETTFDYGCIWYDPTEEAVKNVVRQIVQAVERHIEQRSRIGQRLSTVFSAFARLVKT